MQIKNVGTSSHTINSITISNLAGSTNLGRITIYLFANQTDSPATGNPIGSVSLTGSSRGIVNLPSSAYTLSQSANAYIEVQGCAASNALTGSTVGFTLKIQCEDT